MSVVRLWNIRNYISKQSAIFCPYVRPIHPFAILSGNEGRIDTYRIDINQFGYYAQIFLFHAHVFKQELYIWIKTL
ncbi:hypothetical protein Barb6_03250 [Bacteroidales bacterium Barb6]|nr:hypothetical protein Barb6_03250 [Bacteroidales bacterium Barb6]